ncbi:hypothetical protein [Amycolatopsis sp. NPDC051371]|uniref:hypothetical protein n=1 Tax=Amycolatopsis sp. NPDC051371 TaxID=3155800 RepID=UPI00341F03F3
MQISRLLAKSLDKLRMWVPWDLDAPSVDMDDDLVRIRVIALALPLPPILLRAEAELRSALDESGRTNARLRLVVTDFDASAFSGDKPVARVRQGDRSHTIGS